MWLASVALRDSAGEIIGTENWTPDMWRYAEMTLKTTALGGVGDRERERFFRMCITACLHRGLTPREMRKLPQWWHAATAIDIAGGPVEILWAHGVADIPSTRPCENMGRAPIDTSGHRPDLWLPVDCGECLPCRARAAAESAPACVTRVGQARANRGQYFAAHGPLTRSHNGL